MAIPNSPWMDMISAGIYLAGREGKARSPRFVRREIHNGRLKGVRIGGKGELLTRAQWCDEYLEAQMVAVPVRTFRRA